MANSENRALIACSVSALALAFVTLYYWQSKKKRKISQTPSTEKAAFENIGQDQSNTTAAVDCKLQTNHLSACASEEHSVNPEDTQALTKTSGSCSSSESPVAVSTETFDTVGHQDSSSSLIGDACIEERSSISAHQNLIQTQVETTLNQSTDFTSQSQQSCSDLSNSLVQEQIVSESANLLESSDVPLSINTEMHLKKSENVTPSLANVNAPTNGNSGEVLKAKQYSLNEDKNKNHVKISSIEFDNNSKSTNSVLTIEVVNSVTNDSNDDSGDFSQSDISPNSQSSDQVDVAISEPKLHKQKTTNNLTSDKNLFSSVDANNSSNFNIFIDGDNINGESKVEEEEEEEDACAGAADATAADTEQQCGSNNHSQPQSSPAPPAIKPPAAPILNDNQQSSESSRPIQTFAQVLCSRNKPADAIESTQNSATTTTMQPQNMSTDPKVPSEASLTCEPIGQSKEEVDVYQNYPDYSNSPSNSSPLTSAEQCSPNSQFGECGDDRSQGSNDSGKGSSDMLHVDSTNPYNIVNIADDQQIFFHFEMPYYLCGKLIGTGGKVIKAIKKSSNAHIMVNAHYYNDYLKICSINGKKSNVINALNQIRELFPINKYPDITLRQVNLITPTPTIPLTQACQLQLLPDIVTEVYLSCTIDPGHFFLQQPIHPTYPKLNQLDKLMTMNYSQTNAPLIPQVHPGIICAAPTADGWFRALIKNVYETEQECDIMFVDYGGYAYNVPVDTLRQIRFEFMSLPFQASECYLSNVLPVDESTGWTPESIQCFEELAQGQIIHAFINGYSESGIPYVNLIKNQGETNISINKELVNKGHAQWVETNSR